MKSIQHLVIISPGFPKDENDSTCIVSQQKLVLKIKALYPKLRISILALDYPFIETPYRWFDLDVIPFNGLALKKYSRVLLWWKVLKKFRALKQSDNIDAALAFWCGESMFLTKAYSKLFSVPYLCWILGQDAKRSNKFIKWIKPSPTKLVAASYFLQQHFFEEHKILPMHIIENGIDTVDINTDVDKSIDIIGVGSLIELKQFHVVLTVTAAIRNVFPRLTCRIYGDGPERGNLEKQIQTLGLGENVKIVGLLPHKEVLDTMAKAKILIHPSSYEGYSTVCLEALYRHCHVVSFAWAEQRGIENWHIVVNKEEMIARCVQILSNYNKPRSVMLHSIESSAEKIMKLLHSQL